MIETIYTVTEAEFTEARKLWCPQAVKKLPGHILLQVVLLCLLVLIVLSVPYLPFWLAMAFSGCLAIFAITSYWRKTTFAKIQYAQLAEQMSSVSLRIDEDGYHDHKEASGSGWIAWKRFTGWREGKTVFILGINLTFVTIPKTALSPEQQAELCVLLKKHILVTT